MALVVKNPLASAGGTRYTGSIPGWDPNGGIPWRRKWQSTPVFLPKEFHGHWSMAGYSPWGLKELDMTQ